MHFLKNTVKKAIFHLNICIYLTYTCFETLLMSLCSPFDQINVLLLNQICNYLQINIYAKLKFIECYLYI